MVNALANPEADTLFVAGVRRRPWLSRSTVKHFLDAVHLAFMTYRPMINPRRRSPADPSREEDGASSTTRKPA
jgi:hypothetical protein